ncbi:hypothetical protein OH809_45170 (plasmid) [Streptomyces sp. NBC_00873]|uniref:hypothetical protein n=1 Tax=Streptomyces sp. NBC_00873 TaxID=2975852 RepID=UPI0038681151|nr:hypothetical protein OH809_45170 [Streptomyces sp. NBC_00873]
MTRMLGTWSRPWCPYCHGPAGEDCPSRSWSKKTQRAREKRAWRRVSEAAPGHTRATLDS